MDGETIRLIVVALGAIIAGLSGALIAGAYSSRNTLATIEAARVNAEAQREADRVVEHDRWLRDRKVDVYSKLLEDLNELELTVTEVQRGYSNDSDGLVKKARNLSSLHLRVIAPKRVRDAALEVLKSVQALISELIALKHRSASDMNAYNAASKDFRKNVTLLELEISDDLGIERDS